MSREISFCVFTTHASGREDQTPLRFISDELLAHYREAEVIAVLACAIALAIGLAGLIIACTGPALVIG